MKCCVIITALFYFNNDKLILIWHIYKMEYLEKMAEDHRINAEINDLSVIAEDGEETGDGLDYM